MQPPREMATCRYHKACGFTSCACHQLSILHYGKPGDLNCKCFGEVVRSKSPWKANSDCCFKRTHAKNDHHVKLIGKIAKLDVCAVNMEGLPKLTIQHQKAEWMAGNFHFAAARRSFENTACPAMVSLAPTWIQARRPCEWLARRRALISRIAHNGGV